jgi:hypothetical protein
MRLSPIRVNPWFEIRQYEKKTGPDSQGVTERPGEFSN